MRNFFTTVATATFICAAGFGAMTGHSVAQSGAISISGKGTQSVTVEKGKPKTIRTSRPYYEIVVGDEEIVTVQPMTDRSFYVIGKEPGTTGITLFDNNGQPVGAIDLEISVDTTRLKKSIAKNVPGTNIKVSTSNGQVVLSGSARDKVSADMANRIAKKFSDDVEIINDVSISTSQQVQLNVRFVEINRNVGVGFGVESATSRERSTGDSGSENFDLNLTDLGGNFLGRLIAGGLNIDLSIQALEDRGLARSLAEPNLIARSGEKASFLAGGEFPIRVADGQGGVAVEYKKFGVGLDFSPTVLKDGLISLEIAPEVSSIDRSGGNGLPIFLVRRASTSIDLKSGQSFMMAGLFQAENTTSTKGLPGISKVPIIGALFSSKQFSRKETDLVMIVTPHLVKPIDPTTPVVTPADDTRAATVAEATLLQVDEVKTSALPDKKPQSHGHVLTLDIDG